jgi:KUP system potassium uptake protein
VQIDMMETSFFLSRETIVPVAGVRSGMALWRERLFATMSRNAGNAAEYFGIPANRVIEIGTQIQI